MEILDFLTLLNAMNKAGIHFKWMMSQSKSELKISPEIKPVEEHESTWIRDGNKPFRQPLNSSVAEVDPKFFHIEN